MKFKMYIRTSIGDLSQLDKSKIASASMGVWVVCRVDVI